MILILSESQQHEAEALRVLPSPDGQTIIVGITNLTQPYHNGTFRLNRPDLAAFVRALVQSLMPDELESSFASAVPNLQVVDEVLKETMHNAALDEAWDKLKAAMPPSEVW